jgi:hypothetical protein
VTWEVRRSVPNSSSEDRVVRSGEVPAGKTAFDVEALEPGDYRVIVKGDRPLQRFGVPITVSDGLTTEAAVRITPAEIDLDVLFDNKPLDGATVDLSFEANLWHASVKTDAEGHSSEKIWRICLPPSASKGSNLMSGVLGGCGRREGPTYRGA